MRLNERPGRRPSFMPGSSAISGSACGT